jgi:hypothetical protein
LELLPITGLSISIFDQSHQTSLIHATDTTAQQLEEMHFDLGEGPMFDAFATAHMVAVPDLTATEQWPAFLRSAMRLDVGAVFVFPLMLGAACTGAVTCYRREPGPLDGFGVDIGESLSRAIAGPASLQAIALASNEPSDQDGGVRPESRREVHQATGMVQWQLSITSTDALSRLQAYAFSSGCTVHEVAHDVVNRRLNFAELPD